MNINPARISRFRFLLLVLFVLLVAACSPATSPSANTVQPTLAATSTTAALAPAPTEAPAIKAATLLAAASPTAPTAYPEPQTGVPEDAYPIPALAESLEGYPGVTIMEAPDGLDLDPATVGMALPLLWERLAAGETVTDLESLADPLLTLIAVDAAQRSGVEVADLTAVAIQPVTWSSTGLGCPDPEMGYAQVQIEGYVLTLAAAAEALTYHTDGGLQIVLCQDGTPVAISPAPQQ